MSLIAVTVTILAVLYILYWSPGARRWFFFLLRLIPGTFWLLVLAFLAGMCMAQAPSQAPPRPSPPATQAPVASVMLH